MYGISYYHLKSTTRFHNFNLPTSYAAIVLIGDDVKTEWRNDVSTWLVETGCLYMMAWGLDCSLWDDSVDNANIENCDFKRIPDEKFVLTTWHDDESLGEVFWFAKNCAKHSIVDLTDFVILDIHSVSREKEIVSLFHSIT